MSIAQVAYVARIRSELAQVRGELAQAQDELAQTVRTERQLRQEAEQRAEILYAVLLRVHKVLTDDLLASSPISGKHQCRERAVPRALKKICKLARIAQCDMSDVIEYGGTDKTQEERKALESIEIKIQAILRHACEALEGNDATKLQEHQAAQDQSDEVQALWLSPREAEGLKRQLAKAEQELKQRQRQIDLLSGAELRAHQAEAQVAAIGQAVEWLWGFWDGNTLIARSSGYEEDIGAAWNKLLETSGAFSKPVERLEEVESTVHAHEHALNERDKALITEHRLRREAEERARKDTDYIQWLHQILREGGYILSTNEDGISVLSHNPLRKLEREKARAEQRAEALAALAGEETAALLERLAEWSERARGYAVGHWTAQDDQIGADAEVARALAARIRETLSER